MNIILVDLDVIGELAHQAYTVTIPARSQFLESSESPYTKGLKNVK